jgi:hypothetical protein
MYNDEYLCIDRVIKGYKWLNCVIARNIFLAQNIGGVKMSRTLSATCKECDKVFTSQYTDSYIWFNTKQNVMWNKIYKEAIKHFEAEHGKFKDYNRFIVKKTLIFLEGLAIDILILPLKLFKALMYLLSNIFEWIGDMIDSVTYKYE